MLILRFAPTSGKPNFPRYITVKWDTRTCLVETLSRVLAFNNREIAKICCPQNYDGIRNLQLATKTLATKK